MEKRPLGWTGEGVSAIGLGGMERSPEGGIRADNRPETVRRSCDESLQNLISGERYPESMMGSVNV